MPKQQPIKLTEFYRDVLGANLRNVQWSWGAVDPSGHRIYLRVWKDQIRPAPGGGEMVQVLWKGLETASPGLNERLAHLDAIRQGAEAYAVVLEVDDPHAHPRRVIGFDSNTVLRLGGFEETSRGLFARIEKRIPVADLRRPQTSHGTLAADLRNLASKKLDPTTREALVDARLGQGAFRQDVLRAWEHRCAVTGIATTEAIRASHIKPWRASTDAERRNPHNGLPLVATLDALFDEGLITFDSSGVMQISARIPQADRAAMGLSSGLRLRRAPGPKSVTYLQFHRDQIFRGR